MDKNLRSFLLLAGLLLVGFVLVLAVCGYIYRHSTLNVYNGILLVLMLLILFMAVFFVLMTATVFQVYRKQYVLPAFTWIARLGLAILFPAVEILSSLLKDRKDIIRSFCISINNIIVRSTCVRCLPEQILLLLPHCLQNSDCRHKITNDTANCRKCGKCCMGEVIDIASRAGIEVKVVTGGTVARKIISTSKPQMVVSVACERDLASGIADVRSIPVIGMINERPNGPCCNTRVDISALQLLIESILKPKNLVG